LNTGNVVDPLQHRTARRFTRPSPLFRWCEQRGLFARPGYALVFGAGLLVEARALSDMGWTVDALETPASLEARRELYEEFDVRPRSRVLTGLSSARPSYRIIVVTHVLEFVPSPRERSKLLHDLGARLSVSGRLLLSLRGWSDVLASKIQKRMGDGVTTGLGTWVRGYSIPEALDLVHQAGLAAVESMHGPRAKGPEQVRMVCQRT